MRYEAAVSVYVRFILAVERAEHRVSTPKQAL